MCLALDQLLSENGRCAVCEANLPLGLDASKLDARPDRPERGDGVALCRCGRS